MATKAWLYVTPTLPPTRAEVVIVNAAGCLTKQLGKVISTCDGPTLTTLVSGVKVNVSKLNSPTPSVATPPRRMPTISQEVLAEMVGTTRARINTFMNKFRQLGFIDYNNGVLEVHDTLLSVVLHDSSASSR